MKLRTQKSLPWLWITCRKNWLSCWTSHETMPKLFTSDYLWKRLSRKMTANKSPMVHFKTTGCHQLIYFDDFWGVKHKNTERIYSQCFQEPPANIYLFKVNNRNSRKRCEICSKLTIKTAEWRQGKSVKYVQS